MSCRTFVAANDDVVDFGDDNAFSFGDASTDDPFSISVWTRWVSVINCMLASKASDQSEWEWDLLYYSNNIYFVCRDMAESSYIYGLTSWTPSVNTWIHTVFTYDGSGAKEGFEIYIDGVKKTLTRGDVGYTAMHNTAAPMQVGGMTGYPGTPWQFNGQLADFRLDNRELFQADVDALLSGKINGLRNGLVCQPLLSDPGADPTIRDWSGNGHDGTNDGTDASTESPPLWWAPPLAMGF